MEQIGATSRNRTGDILLTRQLLYLLSYRGEIGRIYRDRTYEALIPNEVAYRFPNLRGRHQQSEPVLVAVVVQESNLLEGLEPPIIVWAMTPLQRIAPILMARYPLRHPQQNDSKLRGRFQSRIPD